MALFSMLHKLKPSLLLIVYVFDEKSNYVVHHSFYHLHEQLFCGLGGTSKVNAFSSHQTRFLMLLELLLNLFARLFFIFLFFVLSLICGIFKCLNCFNHYLSFFSQMNDWCQCYFPSLLITYDIFLWATGLLRIRQLNAAPFCENYTKLYFDAKDLEKGLNREWWYFWCPFFTKCALSGQYWTQL